MNTNKCSYSHQVSLLLMPRATRCLSLKLLLQCLPLALSSLAKSYSLPISSKSASWQVSRSCAFFFVVLLSKTTMRGTHAAGLKPQALFRDLTSHVGGGGHPHCLLAEWQDPPSEASAYWRSSKRCMEVNVLLDMQLYWWERQRERRWEGGGGREQ